MTLAFYRSICALACFLVIAASGAAAEVVPEELSIASGGRAIEVTRYAAEGAGARPAVLVLHGSRGIEVNPQAYARHALALAKNGFDAYLVRYFGPGSNASCNCWDAWAATVADVTTAILRRPEASGRVGLVGFSLGGAVAVTSASDPRIAALVVYYGFVPDDKRTRSVPLPPLLVVHGGADDKVPLSSGQDILKLARQLGGRAELVVYPGERHGHSTWGEPAATDAIDRTIVFLRAELMAER